MLLVDRMHNTEAARILLSRYMEYERSIRDHESANQDIADTVDAVRAITSKYGWVGSDEIQSFLEDHELQPADVDVIIFGYNGDTIHDPVYDRVGSALFGNHPQLWYKHLCGEYYTSTGFATWLGANILKHQSIPAAVKRNDGKPGKLDHILIYNQYRDINHSLLLLRKAG